MKYVILVKPDQHYEYDDPIKFKDQLTKLCENKGEDVNEVLSYFFHRHFVTYLWHINMQAFGQLEFTGPKDLIERSTLMTEKFKEWLGEERSEELITHAHGVFKDMMDDIKSEEE